MPAHPCSKTTAGNGPGPVGRSSHAGTVSGLPGVAFGNERFVVAQPAIRIEAQSTDSGRRSMNRAYTAAQRGAKRERLGRGRMLTTRVLDASGRVCPKTCPCAPLHEPARLEQSCLVDGPGFEHVEHHQEG